jgi:hypothetical protein
MNTSIRMVVPGIESETLLERSHRYTTCIANCLFTRAIALARFDKW